MSTGTYSNSNLCTYSLILCELSPWVGLPSSPQAKRRPSRFNTETPARRHSPSVKIRVGWVVQAKHLLHFKALILQMSKWLTNFTLVCYWVGRTILWPVDQGLEISMVRGILWTPHRLDLKTHVVLEAWGQKNYPYTERPKSPPPVWLELTSGTCKGIISAWEEGALCNFTHMGVTVLGGSTVAGLVRVPLAGYP